MERYNGWKNYATWRVNLEIFDSIGPWEDWQLGDDPYELAPALKVYAQGMLSEEGEGLALDYALAFLDQVDFFEIARAMIETHGGEE
jgi:hypothetical protein